MSTTTEYALSLGHMLVQELVKLESLDQLQSEPRSTKPATVLDPDCVRIDADPTRFNGCVFELEKCRLNELRRSLLCNGVIVEDTSSLRHPKTTCFIQCA